MRIVILVVAVVVCLVLAILLVGALVPKTHIASRTVLVSAPPEAVWSAITTVEAYPQWRDLKASIAVPSRGGRRAWRETDRHGQEMTLVVVEEVPHRRLVTRIADKNLGFGGTWTYELTPAAGGTQLTIIEDGEIHNPMFRCVAHFVLGYHSTMDDYLERLKKRVASRA